MKGWLRRGEMKTYSYFTILSPHFYFMHHRKKQPDAVEHLQSLRESLEKEHGRPFGDEEVQQCKRFLDTLAEIYVNHVMKTHRRDEI